jgi:putative transposase
MIDPGHAKLSVRAQCQLLGLSRSGVYYRARESPDDAATNLALMRRLDELYTARPFFGVRRMTVTLRNEGHAVNPKRVRRLLRLMGLEALHPKPKLSMPGIGHKVYPYLLRGIVVDRPDLVWCADITYIRTVGGFVYLMAVMDWYSRCVLAWEVSTTLDVNFCVHTLKKALAWGVPTIFNTDQGSQFTSEAFTGLLLECGVTISMDGRGRAFDNIFIERLWRSVKYEEVYLNEYADAREARIGLKRYLEFYDHQRPHQSLNYRTPMAVYLNKLGSETQPGGREEPSVKEMPQSQAIGAKGHVLNVVRPVVQATDTGASGIILGGKTGPDFLP